MHKIFFLIALVCIGAVVKAQSSLEFNRSVDKAAVESAVTAMCDKSVAILGEASHGDGHSELIKVELVKRLVAHCGFTGVLFEASFYEFLPIVRSVRAKTPVSPELISAAVGGLWKFDREVQPLFTFLATQINSGSVEVGGLDFQAGGYQQPYSNDVLNKDLMVRLPKMRGEFCMELYRSRVYGDAAPDGMSDTVRAESLKSCLLDVGSALSAEANKSATDADLIEAMKNLQAWLANDGHPWQSLVRSRDKMMAENATSFIDRRGKSAKTIIWTHNGHAARSTSVLGDYGDANNLGAALNQLYGPKSFSLAITACAGEYRWSQGTNKALPDAPPDSLEAASCQRNPEVSKLIEHTALESAGVTFSGVLGHSYKRANWADAFDGVLVLNVEFAPHSTRP